MGQTFAKGKVDRAGAKSIFVRLDVDKRNQLTLKQLLDAAPSLVLLHSVPALFYLDKDKDGKYSLEEFCELVEYVQAEKKKVKAEIARDASLREFLQQASEAGVIDCSINGRTNFRRLSHMRNIRSLYRSDDLLSRASSTDGNHSSVHGASSARAAAMRASFGEEEEEEDRHHHESGSDGGGLSSSFGSASRSDSDLLAGTIPTTPVESSKMVSMYCTGKQYDADGTELPTRPNCGAQPSATSDDALVCGILSELAVEELDMRSLDAAVVEKMTLTNIQWLATYLRGEGARESFMQWLWKLVNVKNHCHVGKEELSVLLHAISEDQIDLEELVFDRNQNLSLEERVMQEFGNGTDDELGIDEFMVFADLVTREYEYWEDRHLDCIGPYQLGRILGRGSAGIVRAALNTDDHERYAVKIIKKGKCSDLSRLDREIQSLHIVSLHANVVSLHEVLENDDSLFLVMELCGGGSLIDILRLYPEERLPEDVARHYMRQLFQALSFCHQNGVCHRDVRLENMLLSNDGVLKVTDFGHSGLYSPGWDIFQTSLVGSIFNLSPEQINGTCYSGEKIDVWSAGIALYTLLVGRPPFYHGDNSELLSVIMNGEYEIPMFISDEAFDLLQCMIRVRAEERLSFLELLNHIWFEGPDTAPILNMVSFPVDKYFEENAELAEMITASVFHDYDIHVHIGGLRENSKQDMLLQVDRPDWSLKCSCLSMDMKFSISLFTKTSVADRSSKVSSANPSGDARIGDVLEAIPELSLGMSMTGLTQSSSVLDGLGSCRPRTSGLHARRHSRSDLAADAAASAVAAGGAGAESKAEVVERNVTRIQQAVSEYPLKGVAVSSPARCTLNASPSISVKRNSVPELSELDLAAMTRGPVRPADTSEPHLEVRLCEGDSCLFLKVCRKLKEILLKRLDAAVERQRKTPARKRGCAVMKRIFSEAQFGIEPIQSLGRSDSRKSPSPLSLV